MNGLGLVVAGGAARGAWQAGVLRFLYEELPRHLGYTPWPRVVSGTSVGSLNGVNVAARSREGVVDLARLWREMEVGDIYRVRPGMVATAVYNSVWSSGPFAVLDARPLHDLVRGLYPETALREAIAFGDTQAFIVSATDLDTGLNTLFVDSHDPDLWLRPVPGSKVRRGRITAEHCLASAALPLLFEPVAIEGRLHVDGMLRQNTPVRPVIQTGVSHILVIGIDRPGTGHSEPETSVVPTFAFIAGKALNAVLMDPADSDLRQIEKFNDLVRWGVETYGPDFADKLDREKGIREIRTLRISPSEDLGTLARTVFHENPPNLWGAEWALLSLLADEANVGESDLLSYLLFDRAYTGAIESLGFEDARRHEEILASWIQAACPPPA
jgi:NTE family protein